MGKRTFLYHAIFLGLFTFTLANCSGGDDNQSSTPEYPVMKKPAAATSSSSTDVPADVKKLLATNTCLGCHKVDKKLVGPSYVEIAKRGYSVEEIVALVKEPQPENWPDYPPMAPLEWVNNDDLVTIANWIASLNEAE